MTKVIYRRVYGGFKFQRVSPKTFTAGNKAIGRLSYRLRAYILIHKHERERGREGEGEGERERERE